MSALGRRLRKVREERGIASTRLDELAGVGRGSVHRIEHANRPELSVLVIARIAYYLEVRLDWLVWGDDTEGKDVGPPNGFDVPAAGFMSQMNRLPQLVNFLESPGGASIPLHVLASGLKIFRDKPPPLDPDGVPVEGWARFFGKTMKASAGKRPTAAKKKRSSKTRAPARTG